MSFLSDYVYYSSGNETPEPYLWWGGLSILGHVLGNKVWVKHGDYFRFYPNLYITLVGDAGSGKNSALGVNIDIMLKEFPNLMLSASIQSREDVADLMSSPDCVKTWKDDEGKYGNRGAIFDYRPFYILNNEFASFLSVDKMKMVEFLTEVFDGKHFSTGFKGQRQVNPEKKQWFANPHVSLLAGAVPTWFMQSLKMDLFSGGLGRRMIIVQAGRTKVVPDPRKPIGADASMQRVIAHLKLAAEFSGEVIRDDGAKLWWHDWYQKWSKEVKTDPILAQFHQTKPMQVLKVALNLVMTELPLSHTMKAEHLQFAASLIEGLEEPVRKLTAGIGRNELAGVGSQVLDFIERMGGAVPETELNKFFHRYMRDPEFVELMNHFINTQQLVKTQNDQVTPVRFYYFSPSRFQEFCQKRKERDAQNRQAEKPV